MAHANATLITPRINVRVPKIMPMVLSVDRLSRAETPRTGIAARSDLGEGKMRQSETALGIYEQGSWVPEASPKTYCYRGPCLKRHASRNLSLNGRNFFL